MIIRYAVPEMWLETDVIVIFILGNFYPFTPPISPKNGNFKKMKNNNNKKKKQKKNKQTKQSKTWRYHYFTQVYKKSWSYAMLFLRYMVRDGCNCYFSFWDIFTFYPPNIPKNENFKKMKKREKKHLEVSSFTQVHQKSWSYAILFLGYGVWQIWSIFCPFSPLTSPKMKILKKESNKRIPWRYDFTHVYLKLRLDDVQFLRYGARRTDTRKKWHIEVGAPTKKSIFPTECNSLWDEKKKNFKPNSLIQTLIYRWNIHCSKIYQREDWKNKISTLY